MSRTHVLVEVIRLVHLVCFCLLCVEPALQEFRVVSRKDGVTLFNLAELELKGVYFVR